MCLCASFILIIFIDMCADLEQLIHVFWSMGKCFGFDLLMYVKTVFNWQQTSFADFSFPFSWIKVPVRLQVELIVENKLGDF